MIANLLGLTVEPEHLLSVAAFAVSCSISPGPNNLMLMASGANFGVRRTLPHLMGVSLGFMLMITLVGVGLTWVFDAYPVSYRVMLTLCCLYLLYLAWKIATAVRPEEPESSGEPMTFLQVVLFQWVNPKAWAVATLTISLHAPSHTVGAVMAAAVGFTVAALPCITSWMLIGRQLRHWLESPARLRAFNVLMATLLLLSLYPMFAG